MNKRAYLLAVLGVGIVLILLCLLLPEQVASSFRKETKALIGPVVVTLEKPVAFFSRVDTKLKTLNEAQAEVTKLRAQVEKLTVQNQTLEDRAAENARLREMLGYREASPYHLLTCRVVSREPSNWWGSVQVNVGWADDKLLKADQPVVSSRGVVGKTGNVSQYVTDVILMLDKNCSISAVVDGTHDHGIAQGQGNFDESKPRVKVEYLPKDSKISVGQFLVTSGLGPYFPAGLRLGTVTQVPDVQNTYPTFGLYREAIIEPTADLDQLNELFIVLGPKESEHPAP